MTPQASSASDSNQKESTMDGINYAGNSNKSKEAAKAKPMTGVDDTSRPKVEAVTKGVVRKKPLGRRIAETFTSDDAGSVGEYVLTSVIVPAIKNTLADVVTQGIERMLYGDRARSSSGNRRPQSTVGYTSYNRMSSGNVRDDAPPRGRTVSSRVTSTHNFDEITFDARGDAEVVLDGLIASIEAYGSATVGDLFNLADITSTDFTLEKWGWTELNNVSTSPVRGGKYVLNLPAPIPFDR